MITSVLLSRLQFAFTISFHIIFPSFSVGLAIFLSIMEGVWLKTKNPKYINICKFWTKIFALTFGMGIVSGIVMEFQLGTNWAGFTKIVGNVLGALFTYEVLTAFFIEAGFLGVMLFGWNKVSSKMHYIATLGVTFGTMLSAFWILSANSWMQTPAGFIEVGKQLVVNHWLQVIFNPSVIPRFIHMMLASYIATFFAIAAVSAYYLLKKEHGWFAKPCFSFVLAALAILAPLQLLVGDSLGLEVHANQPIKTAAMEGLWDSSHGADFLLFAIPLQKEQKNIWEIKIPHGAALINTHEWNGYLQGLKSVSPRDQPTVAFVFYSFRIMVGLGLAMIVISLIGLWLRYKKTLYDSKWFLRICLYAAPIGFIALWSGWITTETGRQPWAVYNILRTNLVASNVDWPHVLFTFLLIIVIYGVIFGYFYFHYFFKVIAKGPEAVKPSIQDEVFGYLRGPP